MSLAASKRASELEQALNAWEDNRLLTSGVVELRQVRPTDTPLWCDVLGWCRHTPGTATAVPECDCLSWEVVSCTGRPRWHHALAVRCDPFAVSSILSNVGSRTGAPDPAGWQIRVSRCCGRL